MQSAAIIREHQRGDGAPRGEAALAHSIQYIYGLTEDEGNWSGKHALGDSHYVINRPKCGGRPQVVAY